MSSLEDQVVAAAASVDPAGWQVAFDAVLSRVQGRFVRPEPRCTVRAFVLGLVPDVERKNGWWLAEHAGHARPDQMQRLLARTVWTPRRSATTSGTWSSTGSAARRGC